MVQHHVLHRDFASDGENGMSQRAHCCNFAVRLTPVAQHLNQVLHVVARLSQKTICLW